RGGLRLARSAPLAGAWSPAGRRGGVPAAGAEGPRGVARRISLPGGRDWVPDGTGGPGRRVLPGTEPAITSGHSARNTRGSRRALTRRPAAERQHLIAEHRLSSQDGEPLPP